jgi:protein-S-isoprenylcysteine O-methyltransferase Ste14
LSESKPYNRALALLRLCSVYALVLVLVLLSRPTWASILGGAVFVCLGEGARAWAAGHLLKTKELVVSGPYRYTRNPLYLGRWLILTGFCLMAWMPYRLNLLVLALGYLVFFGYYLRRKERVEPARLRAEHGAPYETYFRAVPAFFPRLTPHGENIRSWNRARFLRNREHWMVAGVAAAVLLFVVRMLSDFTLPWEGS